MALKIEMKAGSHKASIIGVKVVPNSSRDQIVGLLGDALKIKVSAPPEQGKANDAVVAVLAKQLGLGRGQISIVGGHTQAHKKVEIVGMEPSEILVKLSQ